MLCVVTRVDGSGKSSLVHGSLRGEGVVAIDQTPVRGSRRSNPATCTGLLEPVRKAFAKANGVKPALFSADSDGACPACGGAGVVCTDLAVMAGVATTCEVCEGRRFDAAVLEHRLGGKDISEVLAMPVAEALEFFAVMAHADWIIDVGPGAGQDGGRVVFEGTPADLVADRSTPTGQHLAAYVGA